MNPEHPTSKRDPRIQSQIDETAAHIAALRRVAKMACEDGTSGQRIAELGASIAYLEGRLAGLLSP